MTAPVAHIAVTKRFPQFTLDCDVTFETGATSVFGPSGSGKTTLLNCIAGLTRPDSGQITVMGTTLFSASGRKVRPARKAAVRVRVPVVGAVPEHERAKEYFVWLPSDSREAAHDGP